MNRSNFIQPVRLSSTKEVRFWCWLCIIVSSIVCISITIISSMQWYLYCSLTHETKKLLIQQEHALAIATEQRMHRDEQQQLQKKLDTINRYKTNPKNPLTIFKSMRHAIKNMTLQSLSITKNHFELTALCSSITPVTTCLQQLTQEPHFTHITLNSLQTYQDKIQLVIKGHITTKLRNRL